MKKAKQDMLTMAVLMGISAAFYFWLIPTQIRVVANKNTNFTSQTFPLILAAALFVVALIAFGGALLRYIRLRKEREAEKTAVTKKAVWEFMAPLAAFALVLVYALAFKYVGFLISTAVFIPAFLGLLRCRKWKYYAGVYVFCALVYLVFIYILHVPLP